MPSPRKNLVVEILEYANSQLGDKQINLAGFIDESTYRRWFYGGRRPTPASAKRATKDVWRETEGTQGEKVRKKIFQFTRQFVPGMTAEPDQEEFQALLFRLAKADRMASPEAPPKKKSPGAGGRKRVSTHKPKRVRATDAGAIRQPKPEDGTPASSGAPPEDPQRIKSSRLRHRAQHLVGREAELQHLTDAWNNPAVRVVTLVAWGGVGKTSLIAKWQAGLAQRNYDGADYFDWSFYSQGAREQGATSADTFIATALEFFGGSKGLALAGSPALPWEKGAQLAQFVARRRALLVLDGLEPLQHPPTSPHPGELKDPAVIALLKGLAQHNPGLCVVTTRQRVTDLDSYRDSTAPEWELAQLSVPAAIKLLKQFGVRGAEQDFEALVKDVNGHALTLDLLGRYLADAHGGDIRKREQIKFEEADAEEQGGHAFRVMETYEKWFGAGGEKGHRALALVRLLGLFDRPANISCLDALRKAPAIPNFTEPLVNLTPAEWNVAVSRLADAGLLYQVTGSQEPSDIARSLDAHPLVRAYFAKQLSSKQPAAWRIGHRRLYEYFRDFPDQVLGKHLPETPVEMAPLFRAVAHGCAAGCYKEALDEIYIPRIQRGDQGFNVFRLAGLVSGLGAVACFFKEPWSTLAGSLSPEDQSYVLTEAGWYLWFLSRFEESAELYERAFFLNRDLGRWKKASEFARHCSHVLLSNGRVVETKWRSRRAIATANRSKDVDAMEEGLSAHAGALLAAGRISQSAQCFHRAELLQIRLKPECSYLLHIDGSKYCDLLIEQGRLDEAKKRAEQKLKYLAEQDYERSGALNHWILGKVQLEVKAQKGMRKFQVAMDHFNCALVLLEKVQDDEYISLLLLARAGLRRVMGDLSAARCDLAEALDRAERFSMQLLEADCRLEYARLNWTLLKQQKNASQGFAEDPGSVPLPLPARDHWEAARKLIAQTGYHRRDRELADVKKLIQS